jgi:guanylate kinase
VDAGRFEEMIRREEFAEWAKVYGNYYGTPRRTLDEMMARGTDILLEIDAQGALQLKRKFPGAVLIYILPPSLDVLKLRLERRGSDSPQEIEHRLRKAREEIWQYREYHYIVPNDDLKHAVKTLEAVVLAERMKATPMDDAWLETLFPKPGHPSVHTPFKESRS